MIMIMIIMIIRIIIIIIIIRIRIPLIRSQLIYCLLGLERLSLRVLLLFCNSNVFVKILLTSALRPCIFSAPARKWDVTNVILVSSITILVVTAPLFPPKPDDDDDDDDDNNNNNNNHNNNNHNNKMIVIVIVVIIPNNPIPQDTVLTSLTFGSNEFFTNIKSAVPTK